MYIQEQITPNSCRHQQGRGFSLHKACLIILFFLLFCAAFIGAVILVIIFIVKPRKPIFSLQSVKLDSFKLDTISNSNVYVTSVASLMLDAQNPNKFGLRYSSSLLSVLHKGIPAGNITIVPFYQPAHSKNVIVQTRVELKHLNISQILEYTSKKSTVDLRILGKLRVQVCLLHVMLPKIKVALNCEIHVDYRRLTFSNDINSVIGSYKASHPNKPSSLFTQKCSFAAHI